MYRFRVAAETFPVGFDLGDEITAFVEGVPADGVNEAHTVNQTDTDLGSKFGVRCNLATLNGPNVRLAYADNAVINATAAIVIQPLLLAEHFRDNQQFLVTAGAKDAKSGVLGQAIDGSQIASEIPQLPANALAYLLPAHPFVFGNGEELLSGTLPIGAWLFVPLPSAMMQDIDYLLTLLTSFVEQFDISREGDISGSARCIDL